MKQIVIAQRGWVFIGDVTRDGDQVQIDKASVVRRWGTTKGLGEIAANGPTKDTQLDPCPTVRMHALAVVASIDCAEEAWNASR
jgi:hypothetical protein